MKELRTWSLALLSSAAVGGSVLRRPSLVEHGLGCGDGAGALGAGDDVEDSGVIVGGAVGSADAVGEAEFGADVLDDARAEAAGEDLVHDAERVVVGVAALGAEADDEDVRLIDVVLVDEVDAVLRIGEVDVCCFERFASGQRLEGCAELGFHGGAVEVAGDADDDVVGNDGAVVPCLEIVEGDGVDGGVLGLAGVGIVGAVGELDGFAGGDAAGVVVAARDAGFDLLLGELQACPR